MPATQRIATWFSYRASVRNTQRDGGIWDPILKTIHQESNTKPRRRCLVYQFMHEQPEIVNDAFAALRKDGESMDRTERMNKRYDVARQLVTTTYKDMVPGLKQRAEEDHQRGLKEWGLELGDIEEAEDVHLYVFCTIFCHLPLMYTAL